MGQKIQVLLFLVTVPPHPLKQWYKMSRNKVVTFFQRTPPLSNQDTRLMSTHSCQVFSEAVTNQFGRRWTLEDPCWCWENVD